MHRRRGRAGGRGRQAHPAAAAALYLRESPCPSRAPIRSRKPTSPRSSAISAKMRAASQPPGSPSRREPDGASMLISVADDGPGIVEADRNGGMPCPRRQARYRTDGNGLGLAIVADIGRRLWRALSLEDAEPGLRAIVEFPAVSNTRQRSGADRLRLISVARSPSGHAKFGEDFARVFAETGRGAARRRAVFGEKHRTADRPVAYRRRIPRDRPHAAVDHLRFGEDLVDAIDRPGRNAAPLETARRSSRSKVAVSAASFGISAARLATRASLVA